MQTWTNFWNPPGSPPSKDDASQSRYALLDINLTHPIRTTQIAIAHFLQQKKAGVVVHVSSVAGQVTIAPFPMYIAAKHALNGFVRTLFRLETPPASSNLPKIRVNAVAPGLIKTPLWTEHPEKLKMLNPDTKWVTAEDVALVMLDLVEKEEHVGGSILEVGRNVRKVEAFNDPGPPIDASASEITNSQEMDQDMWEALLKQYQGK